MGVLTFGECDDAYEELRRVRPAVLRSGRGGWGLMRATRQEIKEATDDLRAKGVSVD